MTTLWKSTISHGAIKLVAQSIVQGEGNDESHLMTWQLDAIVGRKSLLQHHIEQFQPTVAFKCQLGQMTFAII